MRWLSFVGGPIALVAACGSESTTTPTSSGSGPTGDTTISLDAYSRNCTTDDDCIPITTGDACSYCNACDSNSAIARTDLSKYQADLETKKARCGPGAPGRQCPSDCPASRGLCEAGACVFDVCTGGSCKPRDAGTD